MIRGCACRRFGLLERLFASNQVSAWAQVLYVYVCVPETSHWPKEQYVLQATRRQGGSRPAGQNTTTRQAGMRARGKLPLQAQSTDLYIKRIRGVIVHPWVPEQLCSSCVGRWGRTLSSHAMLGHDRSCPRCSHTALVGGRDSGLLHLYLRALQCVLGPQWERTLSTACNAAPWPPTPQPTMTRS